MMAGPQASSLATTSKLRQAGCSEVTVNEKRQREVDEEHTFSLKKPKRGEVNYVPDHPENQDDDTLEDLRLALADEMKKRSKDITFIRQRMDLTFSLRRKEVVEVQAMVSDIQDRWPALFSEEPVRIMFYGWCPYFTF